MDAPSDPPAFLPRSMSDESNQFQEKVNEYHAQGEEYVRANPTQAVLSAGGVGLAVFALRPAVFIYGAVALYRHFQGTAPQTTDER